MRAIQVIGRDGTDSVVCRDVPEPTPGPEDVVIDVQAVGVVFPDLLQTRGLYQIRYDVPFTLGGECAGVVRSAPASASVKPGDRVTALLRIGAFAETVAVHRDFVFPVPGSSVLSLEQATCLPQNYLTVDFALHDRGGLREGETILVHGAAGGIGTATIQLAHALGARVVAVTSTSEKGEFARKLGAHEVVAADTFKDEVAELTGGRGVDVVLDPVGGDRFTDSLRCLRRNGGRLLVVGFTAGSIPTVKVNRLLLTNTDVRGVGWAIPGFEEPGFAQEQWRRLLPHLEAGVLVPPVSEVFPFERAVEALRAVEDRRVLGKVVLTT